MPPDNGRALAEEVRFGYMRKFSCEPGYQLFGSKFSHCEIDGKWSDEIPKCEGQSFSTGMQQFGGNIIILHYTSDL